MSDRCIRAIFFAIMVIGIALMAACSTAPAAVVVPREVLAPVYACPVANPHPAPALALPVSRAPADVVRAALTQVEQLKADNVALRALLNPYTLESQNKLSDGTK